MLRTQTPFALPVGDPRLSSRFIGCVEGGDAWNANGVGYVEYEGGGHDLQLFEPTGWEDATDL